MQMFGTHENGECSLHSMIKNDPDMVRRYLTTGEKPAMTAGQHRWFMNIMELFRTIQAAGMLDQVLGNPKVLAKQLSLFDVAQ